MFIKRVTYVEPHNCRGDFPKSGTYPGGFQAGSVWQCMCGRSWLFTGTELVDSSLNTTKDIWERISFLDKEQ